MEITSNLKRKKTWPELVEKFESSGLSQRAFSRQEGISATQLSYWYRKLKQRSVVKPFVELPVANLPSAATPRIELELPAGIILKIGG